MTQLWAMTALETIAACTLRERGLPGTEITERTVAPTYDLLERSLR